jgi:predicted DNA-binding WGR domain protein
MTKRYFEFHEGQTNKFWAITINTASVHVHYGRIGTNGQEQNKDFGSPELAQKYIEKKITEKLKEGYIEK